MTNQQIIDYVDVSFKNLQRFLESSISALNDAKNEDYYSEPAAQSALQIALYNAKCDLQNVRREQQVIHGLWTKVFNTPVVTETLTEQSRAL